MVYSRMHDVRPILERRTLLGGLLALFLLLRVAGFLQPHHITFDDSIYATLGFQLRHYPTNYSTESIFSVINSQFPNNILGYLNRPIFKHPPLYPLVLALSYLLLGTHIFAAVVPSLLAWVGICLLTRKIAHALFGPAPGFMAFLFCLSDPMGWAFSVKICAEVILTFLLLLALWFFLDGVRPHFKRGLTPSNGSLWNCGTVLGLACLTKYSAIPYVMAMVFVLGIRGRYACLIWLLTPIFLILSPWIVTQIAVYGSSWARIVHKDFFIPPMFLLEALGLAILCYLLLQPLLRHWNKTSFWDHPRGIFFLRWIPLVLMASPIVGLGASARDILRWDSLPWTTFVVDPPPFRGYYARQLLTCFPFLIVVPFSSLLLAEKETRAKVLTLITLVLLYFVLAILWSNPQIRYLYPIVPVLIVLASASWHKLWKKSFNLTLWPGRICRVAIVLVAVFMLAKTARNDWFFAVVNQAGRY